MMAVSERTRAKRIEEHRSRVMPLSEFSPEKRAEITAKVALPEPPESVVYLGATDSPFALASMPSRAWYEWHWARGIDPHERRSGLPKKLRLSVIERDGLTCGICASTVQPADVHIDHIVPVARGGSDSLHNLRVTHSRCNLSKGARL